ncbi:immune-associated nucleotide-binding protein 9-like [Micropterus salmoides]|uniref:immune-associated nucleotide-binding protein 9-like n=1 Tax=Micropterus salmoides TaxID=27706 RepID=UPI0018EBE684|nr:immune-associated nucleotide-binding protein 9-like [Micropterus salmoides]
MWIKLTGPAAQSLAKAFLGQALLLLQENKGAKRGAEEEDTTIMVTPLGQEAENKVLEVTGRGGTTARVTTVSVSPTRTDVARTAQAEKSIKVLKAYRIVLLGNTGAGKSSLANTIFGEDVFKRENPPVCGTSECRAESKSVHGRRITLIDTPGFFDTHRPEEDMKRQIVSWITECTPGPHAFFIVLQVANSEQDRLVTKIIEHFPEEAFKYAVVVFTHGDQLPEGMKIEEFVHENKCLGDLVKKCGGRCHVIDNVVWKNNQQDGYRNNNIQVAELLNTTDKIVMENKGSCYTNKMLQAVKREIKEGGNTTSVGNMAKGYTSNKFSVSKNVWIKLTGPAAKSLAEALCGPAAVVLQETEGAAKRAAEEKKVEEEEAVATGTASEKGDIVTETDKEAKEKATRIEKEAERGERGAGGGGFMKFICSLLAAAYAGLLLAVPGVGALLAALAGGAGVAGGVGTVVVAAVVAAGTAVVTTLLTTGSLITGAVVWIRNKIYQFRDFLLRHIRVTLLVIAFYSLLLLSFFLKVPIVGTLFLWLLLLLSFLLIVVLFLLL